MSKLDNITKAWDLETPAWWLCVARNINRDRDRLLDEAAALGYANEELAEISGIDAGEIAEILRGFRDDS